MRIVVLELQRNTAELVIRATGLNAAKATTVGHDSVASDFYSLLPDGLAYEVAFAYGLSGDIQSLAPGAAKLAADRVMQARQALMAYGESELGLTFEDPAIASGPAPT